MNLFKNVYFESERLKTQRLGNNDAISLFLMYSDSDAMKYRGSKPMKSIEDAYDMISNQFIANNKISKLRLAIWDKTSNNLIGTLLLTWDNHFQSTCEVGFSFGKEYWRKGYGRETLQMMEKGFGNYKNTKAIKAWCIKKNLASVRIFEKAGFSKIQQNEYPQSHLFIKKIQ